jgi:spoIIIJ-associated protein
MEPFEFIGKNAEEAIQKAAEHFNLPLNRLKVEVVTAGSNGLLGFLGAKKAKVLVTPMTGNAQDDAAEVVREMMNGQAGRAPARRKRAASGPDLENDTEPQPAGQDQDGQAKRPEESPEVVRSAVEVLTRLLAPLDGQAKVQARSGPQGIFLEITGGEAGMIIGRRGQTLESLQYLTNRIVSHQHGRPLRIHVDAGGYHRRRRESLEELAKRMADKARSSGRAVAVGPFTALERRVIHLTLRHEDGVTTVSRGRGEMKKVLIAPRR